MLTFTDTLPKDIEKIEEFDDFDDFSSELMIEKRTGRRK
jgi:hypothetical protein